MDRAVPVVRLSQGLAAQHSICIGAAGSKSLDQGQEPGKRSDRLKGNHLS